MEQQIRTIINDVFYDLQEACGEDFDAEALADTVCDRMFDESDEYRNTDYLQRRAVVVRICREYA
jgi:hypothetical protein